MYASLSEGWCPRPVARRLPLFGRQPCICEHLSGFWNWWSRTVTLRLLRIASAACCYYHYGPKVDTTAGFAPANLSFAGWSLGLLGHVVKNRTAAQVTRREKTSLTFVLSDQGLKLVEPAGVAPAPCGLKVRCAYY